MRFRNLSEKAKNIIVAGGLIASIATALIADYLSIRPNIISTEAQCANPVVQGDHGLSILAYWNHLVQNRSFTGLFNWEKTEVSPYLVAVGPNPYILPGRTGLGIVQYQTGSNGLANGSTILFNSNRLDAIVVNPFTGTCQETQD